MSAPRLFVNEKISAQSEITLRDEAARYIGRVLRSRPGDTLQLFDGSGAEFLASIVRISRQDVLLHVTDATDRNVESPLDVRLVQGISRGERMDTVVQKAVELGVRRITPLQTEFSVVRLAAERATRRRQHWQRIAESACEQCGRNVPPIIDPALSFQEFLGNTAAADCTRLVLLPGAAQSIDKIDEPRAGVELLIGPEGGLSDSESAQALAQGFVPVAMGPRILRTETAAIAALTLVQALWGDLANRSAT